MLKTSFICRLLTGSSVDWVSCDLAEHFNAVAQVFDPVIVRRPLHRDLLHASGAGWSCRFAALNVGLQAVERATSMPFVDPAGTGADFSCLGNPEPLRQITSLGLGSVFHLRS